MSFWEKSKKEIDLIKKNQPLFHQEIGPAFFGAVVLWFFCFILINSISAKSLSAQEEIFPDQKEELPEAAPKELEEFDGEEKDKEASEEEEKEEEAEGEDEFPIKEPEDELKEEEIKDEPAAANLEDGQAILAGVRFNEIAWMGTVISANDEWLELYNQDDEEVDLAGWALNVWESQKAKEEGKSKKISISLKGKISAKGYYLLERTDDESVPDEKADQIYTGALSNEGAYLELENSLGEVVDKLDFSSGWPGGDNNLKLTLERDEEEDDWHTASLVGGTPRKKNSPRPEEPEPEENVCVLPSGEVFINEWLPNPEGVDKGNEWLELFNSSRESVQLNGWKIGNSSGRFFFLDDLVIPDQAFLLLNLPTSFSLKNQSEQLVLFDCGGNIQDQSSFSGAAASGSSFNRDEKGSWRWSRWNTPGLANRLNRLPSIKIKKIKDVYAGMKMAFDASGSRDEDGEKLKFVWDFGDGHKSYLEKTSHSYASRGKYKVTLKVSDGSETLTKEMVLKVKEFPSREIRIVRVLPNPEGVDAEKEMIWLKNLEKKRINLKGWKIFSGSNREKATGHLINGDFFLERGEEKALSRQESLFSLNNKAGYVALAYPNGKKVDELEYGFEGKNILEGAQYFLSGGSVWQWQFLFDEPDEEENFFDQTSVLGQASDEIENGEAALADFFQDSQKKKTLSWEEIELSLWQKESQPWLKFLPGIF